MMIKKSEYPLESQTLTILFAIAEKIVLNLITLEIFL